MNQRIGSLFQDSFLVSTLDLTSALGGSTSTFEGFHAVVEECGLVESELLPLLKVPASDSVERVAVVKHESRVA